MSDILRKIIASKVTEVAALGPFDFSAWYYF